MTKQYDVAIIGGGIVGLATAWSLAKQHDHNLIVIEAEDALAQHQTGHNSGVIHSGLYYRPGSNKAQFCVQGAELMVRFCEEHQIPFERCGKLVVASKSSQLPQLDELHHRGQANGLRGVRLLSAEEVFEFEPYVACVQALHVPDTGIVNYGSVTKKLAQLVVNRGHEVRTSSKVMAVLPESTGLVLETATGVVRTKNLINCAGLQSDRVAQLCGTDPGVRIVPFRGEYYRLDSQQSGFVKNLVYPVIDPQLPFLGVHFTRMIHGVVEAGPNAVLAFRRDGYARYNFSARDVLSWLTYAGFWKMAMRYWPVGLRELWRSLFKGAFVKSLRTMIPAITKAGLVRSTSGVRAQAIAPTGELIDDFKLLQAQRMIHVLNAPSPAATASIPIGDHIAQIATQNFGL